MKLIKNITLFLLILVFAASCNKDDKFDTAVIDNITAPTNVSAIFDITPDNSGLVTIVPQAEGVAKFLVSFGDVSGEDPEEYAINEEISHIYKEGLYDVKITAIGLSGLKTDFTQQLNVTFKQPQNLIVKIVQDEVNPKIVTVSAKADLATVMDIYFGDVADEVPAHAMPGEEVQHTYENPGDYTIKVVAKSAGAATTEYSEIINIPSATDPVELPITFESFTVNYVFGDFGNAVTSVIDNPNSTGINTSSKVGQQVKTAGAETWAGTVITLGSPVDFSENKLFKVKVWSPKAGAVVKLKVENLNDGEISMEVDALTTVSNEWEELQFDFSTIDVSKEYQKVVIFFDFGNSGDDSVYYFDDIKLVLAVVPSGKIVEDFEGTPPTFTAFGNIADIEVVANPDPSGANTTANVAKLFKTAGSEVWAGAFFEASEVLDFDSYNKLLVRTWSPKSGIDVKLKLENADASITFEVDVTNTTSNAWEDLIFDFSDAPVAEYNRIVIFFDFGNAGDNTEYYYDQIELTTGEAPQTKIFEDFESEIPPFTAFGNIADIEVLANPDMSGANTTANVAKMIKTAGSEIWAGCYFEMSEALDLNSFSKIKVRTWSPKSGIVVKLKLENADASVTHEVDLTNNTANSWEELIYDFSEAPAGEYVKVVIFFDFGNAGDDSEFYFDEFELLN